MTFARWRVIRSTEFRQSPRTKNAVHPENFWDKPRQPSTNKPSLTDKSYILFKENLRKPELTVKGCLHQLGTKLTCSITWSSTIPLLPSVPTKMIPSVYSCVRCGQIKISSTQNLHYACNLASWSHGLSQSLGAWYKLLWNIKNQDKLLTPHLSISTSLLAEVLQ